MMDLRHCTADMPCWEHHQPWSRRVMQADLDAARALVCALVGCDDGSKKSALNIKWAAALYADLHGQRWREMVREPFNFPPYRPTVSPPRFHLPTPEPRKPRVDAADLMDMI